MKDFLMREKIEEKNGIKVTRTRMSTGYASISVSVFTPSRDEHGALDRSGSTTTFSFSNEAGASDYEVRARALATMLDAIVNDSCELPAVK